MPEDSIICTNCGMHTDEMARKLLQRHKIHKIKHTAPTEKAQPKKPLNVPEIWKRKAVIISVVCLLVAAAVIAVALLRSPTGALDGFKAALAANRYEDAANIYQSEVEKGNEVGFSQDIQPFLLEKVSQLQSDFNTNTITIQEVELASSYLDDYPMISSQLTQSLDEIDRLSASKVKFKLATEQFNNNDYILAILNFRQVIESDNDYDTAQKYITEGISLLRKTSLEEAKKLGDSGEWEYAVALLEEVASVIDDPQINEALEQYRQELKNSQKVTDSQEAIYNKLYEWYPWLRKEGPQASDEKQN